MSKRVKRWRVSDVVKALCEERGFGWSRDHEGSAIDGDAAYVMREVREGQSFDRLVNLAPYSLPIVFDMEPLNRDMFWERQPGAKLAVEALAAKIVAEARRLKVPRRA